MKIKIKNKEFEVIDTNQNFWSNIGNWEPETFNIFDIFLDAQHTYLDIGAWIGPTVLYGSSVAKKCIALEPDPIAYNTLKKNIQLNKIGNVVALPIACTDTNSGIYVGVRG